MSNGDGPDIVRGEGGNVSSMTSEQPISGPLGIWPFPILNALLSNSQSRVTVTEIRRDSEGRIQSLEEYEL